MRAGFPLGPNFERSRTMQAAREIWNALGGDPIWVDQAHQVGQGALPSCFAVSDLASGCVAAGAAAIREWTGSPAPFEVDRRLASLWFRMTLRPRGWSLPPEWDPTAGDYQAEDGWIRLHTNAPHHRAAALVVLGVPAEKDAVTHAVAGWRADALEAAVVAQGGCAAAMRDRAAWRVHPNGSAVANEPLVWTEAGSQGSHRSSPSPSPSRADRPLAGIRVLDLTRLLAGPVATRFLAAFGADVLRIDPPDWEEPALIPEVTLGKRCARLDLRRPDDLAQLKALLADADILVHGYRADALDRLGLGTAERQRLRPGLVDVRLNAYGWTGPWSGRRGFDSLVQMSSGIAAEGMRHYATAVPKPLPVQALDHATGYLMAAAAIRGLTRRRSEGIGMIARTSLARTAALLASLPVTDAPGFDPVGDADHAPMQEATDWGPAHRLAPPLRFDGFAMAWDRGASRLGSADPVWLDR